VLVVLAAAAAIELTVGVYHLMHVNVNDASNPLVPRVTSQATEASWIAPNKS
jgi:hypothetical protein